MEEYRLQRLKAEVGEPMVNGLITLRDRLRNRSWKNIKPCWERSSLRRIVIEAETSRGKKHWFYVGANGDICPGLTEMCCK